MRSVETRDHWVVAVIAPHALEDVHERLSLIGIGDMTASHAMDFDGAVDSGHRFRGRVVKMSRPRIRIELGCTVDRVESVVSAIRAAAHLAEPDMESPLRVTVLRTSVNAL